MVTRAADSRPMSREGVVTHDASEINNPDALVGLTAYDRTGRRSAASSGSYLTTRPAGPDWATVKTGLSRHEGDLRATGRRLRQGRQAPGDVHLKEAGEGRAPGRGRPASGRVREAGALRALRPDWRPAARPATAATTRARPARCARIRDPPARPGSTAAGESHGRHAAGAGAREPAMRGAPEGPGQADDLIRSRVSGWVGVEEAEVGRARLRKVVETET